MTDPDSLDQLEQKAAAATAGPWFQGREHVQYESDRDVYSKRDPNEDDSHDIATYVWSAEDAEFIAAANPHTVQTLINEHRALAAKIARVEALANEWEHLDIGQSARVVDLRAALADGSDQ